VTPSLRAQYGNIANMAVTQHAFAPARGSAVFHRTVRSPRFCSPSKTPQDPLNPPKAHPRPLQDPPRAPQDRTSRPFPRPCGHQRHIFEKVFADFQHRKGVVGDEVRGVLWAGTPPGRLPDPQVPVCALENIKRLTQRTYIHLSRIGHIAELRI